MYLCDTSLDDLLRKVFKRLINCKNFIKPSRSRKLGPAAEITAVLLQLTKPRARLSRTESKGTVFSGLGELLWYFSKSNDLRFITYYISQYKDESDDGKTVYGGYGPRLFKLRRGRKHIDQLQNVCSLLTQNPHSRRAVIQLFDAADIAENHKEIPCTCTLQFLVRAGQLDLIVTMRSNDAYLGLPHDVFAFTMLQEFFARRLGVELGTYKHFVGSLHLYQKHRRKAQQFLDEGFQPRVAMPSMPNGDPSDAMAILLEAEAVTRSGKDVDLESLRLDNYWLDLIRLLQIYRCYTSKQKRGLAALKRTMSVTTYNTYIDRKVQKR